MIASDVDRTLLMTDGTLTEETVQAILEAQRRGILFVICSGRFPEHVGVVLAQRGIVCPIIGINGGTLWDAATDKVIANHMMSEQTAQEVHAIVSRSGIRYYVFGRKTLASNLYEHKHGAEKVFGEILEKKYGVEFSHGPEAVRALTYRPVSKFIVIGTDNPDGIAKLREELHTIKGIEVTSSGLNNIEILPAGVSKGTGVTEMAAAYGIPLEHVMAVGDYENDVPMFRVTGCSVAMGNAPEFVKQEARFVTATNDENGLAQAIRRFALHEKKEEKLNN